MPHLFTTYACPNRFWNHSCYTLKSWVLIDFGWLGSPEELTVQRTTCTIYGIDRAQSETSQGFFMTFRCKLLDRVEVFLSYVVRRSTDEDSAFQ